MSTRRDEPRRDGRPAPVTVGEVSTPTPRRRWATALRLLPYALAAAVLGTYLTAQSVPDAGWVAAGTFGLLVALAEGYRALAPRLGHLTALAALCVVCGLVGGFFAVGGWACTTGTCTPSETGTAILSGALTPLLVWMLFAPPVVAVRAVRLLWERRTEVLGWVWSGRGERPPAVAKGPRRSYQLSRRRAR